MTPGRLAECAHTCLELRLVDGIDQPDATFDGERVRRALQPLVARPPESVVPLVKQLPGHAVA